MRAHGRAGPHRPEWRSIAVPAARSAPPARAWAGTRPAAGACGHPVAAVCGARPAGWPLSCRGRWGSPARRARARPPDAAGRDRGKRRALPNTSQTRMARGTPLAGRWRGRACPRGPETYFKIPYLSRWCNRTEKTGLFLAAGTAGCLLQGKGRQVFDPCLYRPRRALLERRSRYIRGVIPGPIEASTLLRRYMMTRPLHPGSDPRPH